MKKIESEIYQYLKDRKWDNLLPSNVAKSISIEAAELLELFQWTNNTVEETKKELADVFIYAFDMAVILDIDTEKIIKEKLEHVKKKYPPA